MRKVVARVRGEGGRRQLGKVGDGRTGGGRGGGRESGREGEATMEERKNCGDEKRRERGERRESSKCADSCKAMLVGGAGEREAEERGGGRGK